MQALMLMGISTLKNKSFSKGYEDLRNQYSIALYWAWHYWPLIIVGLYSGKVPLRFGNLYMDSFALGWAVVLSYIANNY